MKKFFAMLMVIAMLACMMPAAAFADEGVLNWSETSMTNFLGANSSFVGLVFDDFLNVIDVEGKIAVGGDLQPTANGFSGNGNNPASDDMAVIVGGNIVANGGGAVRAHGRILVAGNVPAGVTVEQQLPGGSVIGADKITIGNFFTEAKKEFTALSSTYKNLAANGTVTDLGYLQEFEAVDSSVKSVIYTTSGTDFNDIRLNIAEGQTVLVNFTASEVHFLEGGVRINGDNADTWLREHSTSVIFNFPNATKVTIGGTSLYGVFLAPNATVVPTGWGGNICGTTICEKIDGNGGGFELHLGLGELKKDDLPDVTKKVVEKDDTDGKTSVGDVADYDIGDDVPFELTGSVPVPAVFDKMNTYKYVFHDNMSAGLTFNDDVTVSVVRDGKSVYTFAPGEYSVAPGQGDGCTFEVAFNNLKATFGGGFKVEGGDSIVVSFSAKLNDSAVIGGSGNPNKVRLEYTNGSGTTDFTPWDTVVVFTYSVVADKVDSEGKALKGAGFTLYKLVEGKYEVVSEIKAGDTTVFTFKGLDAGTYKLVETDVPEGYNKAEDLEFKVVPSYSLGGGTPVLTGLEVKDMAGNVISGEGKVFTCTTADGKAETVIVNKSGSVLPETGGFGTKMFLMTGALIALVSGVLLVTKKKMSVY